MQLVGSVRVWIDVKEEQKMVVLNFAFVARGDGHLTQKLQYAKILGRAIR